LAGFNGQRMPWIMAYFLHCNVVGIRAALWWTAPARDFSVGFGRCSFFGIAESGMESRRFLPNSYLPELPRPRRTRALSGSGWAFGYVGVFLAPDTFDDRAFSGKAARGARWQG